ncbi:hypothetical protein CDIK_1495 [Cucumispora dikerogammari]|nr:hypothetical protein CDIK_1495 [Cucumispora dikerogammari]
MVLFLSSFHSIDNADSVNFCTSINHERNMFSIYNYTSTLKMIHDYNCNMNDVDFFDQKMINYNTNRKSNRRTFKLSLFLINVFLNNLYILYIDKKLKYCRRLEFGLKISKYMCTKGETNSDFKKLTLILKTKKQKKLMICTKVLLEEKKKRKINLFHLRKLRLLNIVKISMQNRPH